MFNSGVRHQYFATFCVNILTISYGCSCGWPSASFLVLQSDESPLSTGSITTDETSWIAACLGIGGLVGNLFFGWICDRYGRKVPLIAIAVPELISWILIILATSPNYLYVSRLFAGFAGGGIFVCVPLFVAEISDDNVRGFLGSCLVFACNIGILFAFILGNYFSYAISAAVMSVIPVIFAIGFIFFPESPDFLFKKGNLKGAEKSLRFYRNLDGTDDINHFNTEMDKLKERYQKETKCLDDSNSSAITFKDLTTTVARKAFLIGLVLGGINQFCGCFAMLNYTATIFKEAGSTLTPNMSAIIVGIIQLCGGFVSTVLVDRAGRKILLAVSSIGTGLGLASLGGFVYLKASYYDVSAYSWIPIFSFSFVIFLASCGILTLPFLVIAEIMPPKIRGFGTSFCMTMVWIYVIIMMKCYPMLSMALGMHGCMFLFAGICFAGATFIIICIPETRGKSFDDIMRLLEK